MVAQTRFLVALMVFTQRVRGQESSEPIECPIILEGCNWPGETYRELLLRLISAYWPADTSALVLERSPRLIFANEDPVTLRLIYGVALPDARGFVRHEFKPERRLDLSQEFFDCAAQNAAAELVI